MQSKKFRLPRKKIAEFCKRWSITEFSLFGSVLREDFNPDSDIDVLVSIDPQALRECLRPEVRMHAQPGLRAWSAYRRRTTHARIRLADRRTGGLYF